ncbi:MAG: TatD family hydrolase [Sporolactobacillus sp.]
MLFDSHTHINDEAYDSDFEAMMERADKAGVKAMIVIGVDRPSIDRVFPIIKRYPNVYGAVGWNPEDAIDMTEADFLSICERLSHPKIVALGEIGLDYHWAKSAKDVQQTVFRRQIRAARAANLPLIIHSREATADTARILREEGADAIGGVMHCYSDTAAWAQVFIDLNFYISFGGIITFKNAEVNRAVAAQIPLERLLIETDCPFLSPHPFRGKRNEPAYVRLVAEKLASIKHVTPDHVAQVTANNARRLFRLEQTADHAFDAAAEGGAHDC